jgi:hypothetical protein
MLMQLFLVMGIALVAANGGVMGFMHGTVQHATTVQEPAAGISGTWSATFTIAGQSVPVLLKFAEKDGVVTGTVESDHTGPGTINDGAWKDNWLNCTLKFEKHESIALSGKLKGEIFAGEFRTEGMQGTWEAKRGGTKAIGHMVARSTYGAFYKGSYPGGSNHPSS